MYVQQIKTADIDKMRRLIETNFSSSLMYSMDCLFANLEQAILHAELGNPTLDVRAQAVDHLLMRVANLDKRLPK